jgi:hypothetical protein
MNSICITKNDSGYNEIVTLLRRLAKMIFYIYEHKPITYVEKQFRDKIIQIDNFMFDYIFNVMRNKYPEKLNDRNIELENETITVNIMTVHEKILAKIDLEFGIYNNEKSFMMSEICLFKKIGVRHNFLYDYIVLRENAIKYYIKNDNTGSTMFFTEAKMKRYNNNCKIKWYVGSEFII